MTPVRMFRHVILTLSIGLFVIGCASFSGPAPRAVVVQSYDLPGSLEATAVIRAVERAFTEAFLKPPRIVEGSVRSPLPAMPARVTVSHRLVRLDRLGVVGIPEVDCPGSMATVHALASERDDTAGLRRYSGCIQLSAGGYRVSLVAGSVVVDSQDDVAGSRGSAPKSVPDLLSRVAQALREQISDTRPVAETRAPESDRPVELTSPPTTFPGPEPSTGERIASLASPPERAAALHPASREEDVVSTLPLVCLAPRQGPAPVRSARGEGPVITVLDSGALITVAEPVDAAYFRVETEGGAAGWVRRADVRRLPCPIG